MIATKEHIKEALENILNRPYTADDIMVLFMVFQSYVYVMDTWEDIENVIEEVVSDRPEWHECKKMLRGIGK